VLKTRLKIILLERGIKHEEFAKMRSVSRNTVSAWATGKSTPTLEEAFDIAEQLGVSITDIWSKEANKNEIT
jgi:putative transcriptional regulator